MALSDADLIHLAQQGDPACLGAVLERHRAPLFALAIGILGNGPDAHDAVQETFLIALRRIGQLRDPATVGGWLHAVTRSVCYSQLRTRTRERLAADLPAPLEAAGSPLPAAEEVVDRLALRDWAWAALAELPETLRVTAMLRYFGAYASYDEIAIILGVPVGTVRSRLNQVKLTLADALLRTAELVHDDARAHQETQRRYYVEAFDRYNRKREHEMLSSGFARDLTRTYASGASWHGSIYPRYVYESDLEAGMRMTPTSVFSSGGITIVEAAFLNPPDNPAHCPPATSMVLFQRDDGIRAVRQYYAARASPR